MLFGIFFFAPFDWSVSCMLYGCPCMMNQSDRAFSRESSCLFFTHLISYVIIGIVSGMHLFGTFPQRLRLGGWHLGDVLLCWQIQWNSFVGWYLSPVF
jgi:hypothetical protein